MALVDNKMFILRYANDDIGTTKRHSYNTNRNQRFSRHRHRDRLRQERHTIESERVPQRFGVYYAHFVRLFINWQLHVL